MVPAGDTIAEKEVECTQRSCESPGCWNTAYGTRFCGHCMGGETPVTRGPVTFKETLVREAVWRRRCQSDQAEAIDARPAL